MARIVIAVLLMSATSYAADVSFTLRWDAPTTYLDGSPGVASGYKLYVCDGVISKPTLAAPVTCDGTMQVFDTTETQYTGVYAVQNDNGVIFFRVTALNETGRESLLSNLAIKRYNTFNVPIAPHDLEIATGCVVILNQSAP